MSYDSHGKSGGSVTEDKSQNWALILGASSGFGAASSLALAHRGFHILGVHLDRRSTAQNAEKIVEEIRSLGRKALFFNINAADPERRAEVIQACRKIAEESPDWQGIHLMLHSIAFGTLKPYIAQDSSGSIKPAAMNMTLDVMAHSLVYWTQDLFQAGMLKQGAKIFAMTSAGAHRVWLTYGAVSAAKAALESHVRQLAVELAPFGISVNALQAGVADTPAARRIPGSEQILAALALCESTWATGNVIRVDGGEDLV
jgi:NAD(P)-dependent dehydrogenase (short-subunit alcohol dehydrogenase family)